MESRRFDQLTVSMATGSSRRRVLASLGAIAMGTLLGRAAEAKPSGNKGNSEPNSNASCAAGCAQTYKAKGKKCKNKNDKSAKKECLKTAKAAQAECRQECEAAQNPGTGTGTDTGTGTTPEIDETDGELSALAKDMCKPGADGNAYCQSTVDGTCLIGTCERRDSKNWRCYYTRDNTKCLDPDNPICCNYRSGSTTSGICVAEGALCRA